MKKKSKKLEVDEDENGAKDHKVETAKFYKRREEPAAGRPAMTKNASNEAKEVVQIVKATKIAEKNA